MTHQSPHARLIERLLDEEFLRRAFELTSAAREAAFHLQYSTPTAPRNPSDREFLLWLRDRLVGQYGESPNVDFVLRLTDIINREFPL